MIRIKNLTKDYGKNRGIFDLSFEVQNGEAFGLLGPEGLVAKLKLDKIMNHFKKCGAESGAK